MVDKELAISTALTGIAITGIAGISFALGVQTERSGLLEDEVEASAVAPAHTSQYRPMDGYERATRYSNCMERFMPLDPEYARTVCSGLPQQFNQDYEQFDPADIIIVRQ